MTGDQSKMGMDFKNGVSLAVEEWNSKGGVLGKKIEVLIGDDQHDPKQAVSVANKMVNEGVKGVIGHFNSSCSIPASDVYDRSGIPMISPGSTNPQLTEKGTKGFSGFAAVMTSRAMLRQNLSQISSNSKGLQSFMIRQPMARDWLMNSKKPLVIRWRSFSIPE